MYTKEYINYPVFNLAKKNPGMTTEVAYDEFKARMNRMNLVNTTPVNDVIGWLAGRMVHKHTLDAIVIVYGDRGVGKSYVCGYLGERLDHRLCLLDGQEPGWHFGINNVRSVDPQGTLQLLSPEQLKQRMNQVFIIDDASITANARAFQTQQNQYINYILTTARIYRHCIIINTIASNLLDAVVRSFADISILVKGVIPGTEINETRVYRTSRGNHLGFTTKQRNQFGKYFQLNVRGERIRMTRWYTGKPSDAWCTAYDAIRKENTDNLGNVMADRFKEVVVEGATPTKKKSSAADKWKEKYMPYYDQVIACYEKNHKIKQIVREVPGLTEYGVNRLIQEYNRRKADGG